MNKEQIYDYIKYEGVYNKNVKKRLNKLIKKYHPDHNGDVNTMKLILEVKKELENGLKYEKKKTNVKPSKESYDSYTTLSALDLINKLKKELNDLNKEIEKGYNDEYKLLKEYSDVDKLYKQVLLKIKIDKRKMDKLKLITSFDKIMLVIIIIMLIINFTQFSYLKLFILIVLFIIELLYILKRIYDYNALKNDLNKLEDIIPSYKMQFKQIDEKIKKLKIDIFGIKKLSKNKFADMKRYEKILYKEDEKEYQKDMDYEKTRVKYK